MAEQDPKKITDGTPDRDEVTPGENIRRWFEDFLDLRIGSDRAGAVASIVSGKQMQGSNAWMLVCSILIASLGLNLNSGAVIIGAMLISPLMNPILGIGLGVGTNDWPMLWQALLNFAIAMAIALVTSVLYFSLTPIETFTPEMQARTEPTILDALVAVFGGLAGIISVTREDKTNAIPGVAIATALMPPLCVAGYGLSLLFSDWDQGITVFWRAFYLFFINSFFIAVTAYVIIRLLRFPYRKYMSKNEARRSMFIVLAVSVLMTIPSVFILNDVLRRLREEDAARQFTQDYFPSSASSYLLDRDDKKNPVLIYPIKNRLLSADSLDRYTNILQNPPYNLAGARIVADTSLSAVAMAGIQSKLSAMTNYNVRLTGIEYRLQAIAQQVADDYALPNALRDSALHARTLEQLQIAFPEVEALGLSAMKIARDSVGYVGEVPLALVNVVRQGRRPAPEVAEVEQARITRFLTSSLNQDTVIVIIQER